MAAVAKNPQFAKKVGLKPAVGEDFIKADKGRKFRSGGMSKNGYDQTYVDDRKENKETADLLPRAGRAIAKLAKTKAPEGSTPTPESPAPGMKKGGKVMEKESKSESKKEMAMDKKQDVAMIKKAFKEHDAQEHKGGKGTKITLKSGGKVRGCGIAQRGLTKGKVL